MLGRHFPWASAHEAALTKLFAAYVEAKQAQGVLDYDDLLLYFAQMLAEPEIAAEVEDRSDSEWRTPALQSESLWQEREDKSKGAGAE